MLGALIVRSLDFSARLQVSADLQTDMQTHQEAKQMRDAVTDLQKMEKSAQRIDEGMPNSKPVRDIKRERAPLEKRFPVRSGKNSGELSVCCS